MFSGDKKISAGDSQSIDTLIGENTTFNGDIRFRGGLHVDGHIDGSVATVDGEEGELTLSERGSIKGQIDVPVVVINGCIEGDVVAGKRLELHSQARVSGNLRYRSIQMQLGAEVNGQLVCDQDKPGAAAAKPGAAPVKRVASAPAGAKIGALDPPAAALPELDQRVRQK